MEEDKSNVVQFPVENKRLDVSNISVDPEEVMKEIHLMKKVYISDVADVILDDVLRSIACLNLERSKYPTFAPEPEDMISMKESIVATMYRIIGMKHPMHKIMSDNLVQTIEDDYDDYMHYGYRFKNSDQEEGDESSVEFVKP